ncbi:MAG TPA: AarF/UbiB family protein, partial [Candidatus Polarisedimenticolaceae bacterium]|nr:AarF/UbiB family protein [Candidatus Polarisedimenticolaceae bacterium]
LAAYLRTLPSWRRRQPRMLLLRCFAAVAGLPVSRRIKREPFPRQCRLRLEALGPTYIKLGQVLSLREDLLPRPLTDELKLLLDRLPAVPYAQFVERVREHLGRPVEEVFAHIRSTPLGSGSIGQTHRATLLDGRQVVLKIVKPGVRETLRRDTYLLRGLGAVLQLFLPRFQPRRLIDEFCSYTLREVDLEREADNAEMFAANFASQPQIVFPATHREHSNRDLLCMDYLDGIKPGDPKTGLLREVDRERLIDLGSEAIVSMLYRDGFFHADLHPANLIILPGPRVGFVDLGMVGRLDTDLKRTLLYYYYCLVAGDAENAAHYLAAMAVAGPRADVRGFKRDVEEICRHWSHHSTYASYPLGRLILQSVGRGAQHRVYFPVEMVLMAKAIVTFEAVGAMLLPDFDIAAVSRRHVLQVTLQRFAPLRLAQESLTALPELVDALAKTPRLVTEGLQLVEQATRRPSENPFAGLRATLFGGACLVAGAILAGFGGPWPLWAALLLIGILLPLRRK